MQWYVLKSSQLTETSERNVFFKCSEKLEIAIYFKKKKKNPQKDMLEIICKHCYGNKIILNIYYYKEIR